MRVYAVDPGDMRTDMHQGAFPGEDITDRPEPETVVPALLRLLDDAAAERPLPRRIRPWRRRRPRGSTRPMSARRDFDLPHGARSRRAPPRTARRGAAARRPPGRLRARPLPRPRATTSRPATCVVVNTSATLPAAVDGTRADDGTPVTVHFATALDDGDWVVEVRPRAARPTGPVRRPAAAASTIDAAGRRRG